MKRKIKKVCLLVITLFSLCFFSVSVADVGNFESYDSDWGSSSDWGSYDWDYDYDYGHNYDYGGYYGGGMDYVDFIVVAFLIGFIIVTVISINSKKNNYRASGIRPSYSPETKNDNATRARVLVKLQAVDKYFNEEKFLAWTKNLFVKLQNAWTNRDLSEMRTYETEELFEQHNRQIEQYIAKKQINIMDRIAVNYAKLHSFEQDDDKDILKVLINSSMADYIIDEETKKIVMGDQKTRRTRTYLLTFIRKKGVTTPESTDDLKTTNCPNCGAPTNITSSGKCEYCGSVITTGSHDWVLSNLEPYR